MQKKIKQWIAWLVLACVVFMATGSPAKAQDIYNGHTVITPVSKIQSSVLIIGDSRVAGLAEDIKTTAAYCGTVGAHWHTGYTTVDTRISYGGKLTAQKKLVKAILKKYGECQVVLCASINDIENPDSNGENSWWYGKSFSGITSTANALSDITVKYKGKSVRARIYVAGIINCRGYSNSAVASANKKLAKSANQKKYGYKYLKNVSCSSGSYGFVSDGCHLSAKGSKKWYKAIIAGIKEQQK